MIHTELLHVKIADTYRSMQLILHPLFPHTEQFMTGSSTSFTVQVIKIKQWYGAVSFLIRRERVCGDYILK